MSNAVTCPHCSHQFEVTEVLAAELSTQIRAELQQELHTRREALASQEETLKAMQSELQASQEALDRKVEERLQKERSELFAKAREEAIESVSAQLTDSQTQLKKLRGDLQAAQQAELDVRRREQELNDRVQQQELEIARKLDEERSKIRSSAIEQAEEQHRLKLAEKDQLMEQMRKQIDNLQKKSEQGSQQVQGEAQEVVLEATLEEAFPADEIVPVPKGQNGGDVHQHVRTSGGRECGSIVWESKRTKNFQKSWLPKLRDDQRRAGAECAVIVTEAMPDGVRTVAQIDGVWVCSRAYAVAVGMALRAGIIEVAKARLSAEGRDQKADHAYNYLCSPEFTHHLGGVVEAFTDMLKDLDSEERSAKSRFKKRRKQIERAFSGTAGLYGDLQGLIGNAMPEIQSLEFDDDSDIKKLAS